MGRAGLSCGWTHWVWALVSFFGCGESPPEVGVCRRLVACGEIESWAQAACIEHLGDDQSVAF